jgi:mono/diheme cytochrome c family protein
LKISHLTIVVCALFFAAGAVSAQSPSPDASLTANPVFQKNCEKCHGKTAMGRHFAGPALASDKVAAASADDLRKIISDGKGHMPKFAAKLTPEEIDALVRQVQALNGK